MFAADPLGAEPIATSHWTIAAPPLDPAPPLTGSVESDVAVIGAGYTGLTAALRLAEAGRRVVIVEAEQPGWGASGRNTGQVVPNMWGMHKTPRQIAERFGRERGTRLNGRVGAAAGELFALIAQYGIQCDTRRGYVCVARTPKSLDKWRSVFTEWGPYGGRSELIDRNALRTYVASPRYAGGVLLPDGGHLNPLALSRGLAQAGLSRGVRIFGGSRAVGMTRVASGWQIRTPDGQVNARMVLIGAGAYADALVPALRAVGSVAHCGVLATDPLPDRGESLLPAGHSVADLDDPAVFGPVIDAQGCLVVSFLVGRRPPDLKSTERIVRPRLARAFPGVSIAPFRRLWVGRFLLSLDGVPRIVRIDEGVYAAAACNGLGHTLGFVAAQELADLALGRPEGELDFPVETMARARAPRWVSPVLRSVVFPLANRFGS